MNINVEIPKDVADKIDSIYKLLRSLSIHLGGPGFGRKDFRVKNKRVNTKKETK